MRVQIGASLLSWRRTKPDGQASAANMAPARAQVCEGAGREDAEVLPVPGRVQCAHVDCAEAQPRLWLRSVLEEDWRKEGSVSTVESGTRFLLRFALHFHFLFCSILTKARVVTV